MLCVRPRLQRFSRAYMQQNKTVAVDPSNDFACHPLAFLASIA
jgi:hypothetical protein